MTIDEKKLVLESYIILIDRVEELRTEVADLRDRADSLLSNIDGMPRSQAEASKVERALERIEKSIKELIAEETATVPQKNRRGQTALLAQGVEGQHRHPAQGPHRGRGDPRAYHRQNRAVNGRRRNR